jgi:type II secretory pathway component PulF
MGPISLLVLVIPAIALRIAIRVLYGRRPLASTDPMHTLLTMASTMMFVLAAIGATAGVWILIIPLPIIVAVVVVMVVDRNRQSEHRALLGSLAAAAQHGVPLSEAARAYADETLGDTGLRAMALAEAIERGQSLSTAVRTARLRMSTSTKLAVRFGERLGLLGPAMKQQIDDSHQIDSVLRDTIGRFLYLWCVVMMMCLVVAFVMWKIVPVFERIFEEFGLKLPALTQLVIKWSGDPKALLVFAAVLMSPVILFSVLVAVMTILEIFGRMWAAKEDRRGDRFYDFLDRVVLRVRLTVSILALVSICTPFSVVFAILLPFLFYVGYFPRNLPVVWRFFRRYDGALTMRALSLAVRQGLSLPHALHLVADCYPLSIVAGRIRAAADRIIAGMDWRESLRWTGLISRADAAVLAAAERVGNLGWALEEMADSAIRRQIYRVQAGLQVLFPMVLVSLGLVVCFFVVGLFMPIISLIQGLS